MSAYILPKIFNAFFEVVDVVETLHDLLSHRNRTSVRKSAEIKTRTRNHVSEHVSIGRSEIETDQLLVQSGEVTGLHVGQNKVLRVSAMAAGRVLVGG